MTIALYTTIFFLTMMLFLELVYRDEVLTMTNSVANYYSFEEEFPEEGQGEKLQIAFGMTEYGAGESFVLEPEYGSLKAFSRTWGVEGQPEETFYEELATRRCENRELGLQSDGTYDPRDRPDSARFYKLREQGSDYFVQKHR